MAFTNFETLVFSVEYAMIPITLILWRYWSIFNARVIRTVTFLASGLGLIWLWFTNHIFVGENPWTRVTTLGYDPHTEEETIFFMVCRYCVIALLFIIWADCLNKLLYMDKYYKFFHVKYHKTATAYFSIIVLAVVSMWILKMVHATRVVYPNWMKFLTVPQKPKRDEIESARRKHDRAQKKLKKYTVPLTSIQEEGTVSSNPFDSEEILHTNPFYEEMMQPTPQ